MVAEWLKFKLRMAHPWVLMIVNIMDLMSIMEIELRMVISIREGIKYVESPVRLWVSCKLVKLSVAIVVRCELCSMIKVMLVICHLERMLTIETVVVLLFEVRS